MSCNYTLKEIERGDIFYISKAGFTCGSEQQAGRPAIVVSNNRNNRSSDMIEVVYLTTQDKEDLPTHVTIRSAPKMSTALCEQVHTVSKERIKEHCGMCNKEEIAAVGMALLISLELAPAERVRELPRGGSVVQEQQDEVIKITAERDAIKVMYDNLLNKFLERCS